MIYIGLLVIILALGTALTLFVEVPFGNLLRLMMDTPARVKAKEVKESKQGLLM